MGISYQWHFYLAENGHIKPTPSVNKWDFHINGIFYLAENGHIKTTPSFNKWYFLSLRLFFPFSGFVSVCFMSSLCVISTLCIKFTWLTTIPTVLVNACFVNLVRKLIDSMFRGLCGIYALHTIIEIPWIDHQIILLGMY